MLIFAAVLIIFTLIVMLLRPDSRMKAVISEYDSSVLVIDAGHGGIDGGAIAPNGTKESDLNLAIALKLRDAAAFMGYNTEMTRSTDTTLSDTSSYNERNDLENRVRLANSCNGKLISIHQNSFPTAQPFGSQVIYSDDPLSESLGKLIQNNINSFSGVNNRRIAEKTNGKLYIADNAACPVILIECGFMSNPTDVERFSNEKYQALFSVIILASVIQNDNTYS